VPDDKDLVSVPKDAALLDRAALERVLARASELSALSSDAPEGMTEAQLIEIGKEVGLAPATLQQALAEERTRVVLAEETGLEARVMGPAAVSVTRAIPHQPDAILAALEEWMRTDYRMQVKRRFGNRRTWEQKGGVFAELDRSLRGNQAAATLARSNEVAVTVSPIGDGRTAVRLDADISNLRGQRRTSGIALGSVGVVLGATTVVIGSVLAPVAMLPLFLAFGAVPFGAMSAGGWAMIKGHRKQAERVQLALEQLLDRLEHAPLPRAALGGGSQPLLTDTISAVAQGVRDVARAVSDAAAAKRPR
jgi:hypothetical protein